MLASLSIDYRRPIDSDSRVAVTLGVGELGEPSTPMRYGIRSADGVAATAETVQVAIDRETGESRPVPDARCEQMIAHRERERS